MRPLCLALALALGTAACRSDDGDRIRAEVAFLVSQESEAPAAAERVMRHGRRALPYLESALHTTDPRGRKNIILALRRIGDVEAVPLLRHVALFDEAPDVRLEAEWTLQQWAAGKDTRADRAKAALREIEERRGREATG